MGATDGMNKLSNEMRGNSLREGMRFAEQDEDGNERLDFEEFLAMQPRRVREMHSAEDIRRWFDLADTDGSGELSINEFFCWSLTNAALRLGGNTLAWAFAKYDTDGTGYLDSHEFERAAADMGYGMVSHEIFCALDRDNSGTLTYNELVERLTANVPADRPTKGLVVDLVWAFDREAKEEYREALNTSGWVVRGETPAEVRANLRQLMRESGAYVADLLKIFDVDASLALVIDDVEFYRAMRHRLGYTGPHHVLKAVFASLDSNADGHVSFDELYEFVRGCRHSLDQRNKHVRSMRMQPPRGADFTLSEIRWDVKTLRLLMQQMLQRCRMGATDLMRAWDSNGNGQLTRCEFITSLRALFGDDEDGVWEADVLPVAEAAFLEIQAIEIIGADGKRRQAGGASHDERRRIQLERGDTHKRRIDIIEFERWLNTPITRPWRAIVTRKRQGATHWQLLHDAEAFVAPLLHGAPHHPPGPPASPGGLAAPHRRSPRQQPMRHLPEPLRRKLEVVVEAAAGAREAAIRAEAKEKARQARHLQRWEGASAVHAPLQRWEGLNAAHLPSRHFEAAAARGRPPLTKAHGQPASGRLSSGRLEMPLTGLVKMAYADGSPRAQEWREPEAISPRLSPRTLAPLLSRSSSSQRAVAAHSHGGTGFAAMCALANHPLAQTPVLRAQTPATEPSLHTLMARYSPRDTSRAHERPPRLHEAEAGDSRESAASPRTAYLLAEAPPLALAPQPTSHADEETPLWDIVPQSRP